MSSLTDRSPERLSMTVSLSLLAASGTLCLYGQQAFDAGLRHLVALHAAESLSHTARVSLITGVDSAIQSLSQEATAALGVDGVRRLSKLAQMAPGWDREGGRELSIDSVRTLSAFFRDTGLRPNNVGVFLSPKGHVTVSWEPTGQQLIELEFWPDRIEYYIAQEDREGSVPRSDIGVTRLAKLIENQNAQ